MPEGKKPSLAGRAVLAIVLMIGFYVLALGIVAGLGFLIYLDLQTRRPSGKLIILCAIAALTILWSILPRPDRFVPPGPKLERSRQGRLFSELEKIAKAAGQAMPVEVYLIPDVNAFVTSRGGLLGFGSRRVMGLGLPLMQADTLSQFRATVAHEFGHYYGGDVALGPLIYRTREAIGRTIRTLTSSDSWLRFPFLWYGKMFLRITHAISRQQELNADELACRIVGGQANATSLCAEFAAGVALQPFLENEFLPVLNRGYRPPLAEGFDRFMKAKGISTRLEDIVRQEAAEGRKDPYDTHPPLKERIAHSRKFPPGAMPEKEARAIALLDNLDALEAALLESVTGSGKVRGLPQIEWSDVGAAVLAPMWAEGITEHRAKLSGTTPAALPAIASRLPDFGRSLTKDRISEDDARGAAITVVGAAFALALARKGWTIEAEPGEPVRCRRGAEVVEPFTVVAKLGAGEISAADWEMRCSELGIADVALAT